MKFDYLEIVRKCIYWHSKLGVCVKWCKSTPSCFTVLDGVRQGDVL